MNLTDEYTIIFGEKVDENDGEWIKAERTVNLEWMT